MVGKDLLESKAGNKVEIFECVKHNEPEDGVFESNNMQVGEAKVSTLQEQFSKLSCEEPASAIENSQPETVTNVESLDVYDET